MTLRRYRSAGSAGQSASGDEQLDPSDSQQVTQESDMSQVAASQPVCSHVHVFTCSHVHVFTCSCVHMWDSSDGCPSLPHWTRMDHEQDEGGVQAKHKAFVEKT